MEIINKICYVLNNFKKNNIKYLHKDRQLSVYYSFFRTLYYQIFYKKDIFIGSKTLINHVENIIMNKDDRLEVAFGDFGIVSKLTPTFINIRDKSFLSISGIVRIGRGTKIGLAENAELKIGNNTSLTGDCKIICTNKISIGENCAISWGTQILDSDFHRLVDHNEKKSSSEINIGDNVWIGSNVTILKGVSIGNNCVIGSGSLVNRSFPDNCMLAGNPAIIKKQNIQWER